MTRPVGEDLFTPYECCRGLPLGDQTSQCFANVYLKGGRGALSGSVDRERLGAVRCSCNHLV